MTTKISIKVKVLAKKLKKVLYFKENIIQSYMFKMQLNRNRLSQILIDNLHLQIGIMNPSHIQLLKSISKMYIKMKSQLKIIQETIQYPLKIINKVLINSQILKITPKNVQMNWIKLKLWPLGHTTRINFIKILDRMSSDISLSRLVRSSNKVIIKKKKKNRVFQKTIRMNIK